MALSHMRAPASVHQYNLPYMRVLPLSLDHSNWQAQHTSSLSLPFKHTHACAHAHFPLTVLLCFVRINEKSSLALGVISVLGVK